MPRMITGELLSFLKKKKKKGFIDLCVYIGLLAGILNFFASAGYAVVATNPHGLASYG